MASKKKPISKTMREYRKWKRLHYSLKATEYVAPFAPFAITAGVNYNEWFYTGNEPTKIAFGFVMAVASLALSVVTMAKKDSEFMKKVGIFIPIAFGFLSWGLVCVLLSTILMELGKALLATGAGILAAATADTADKTVVEEKYEYMKQLADENGLTKKGEWQMNAKAQAEYDGEKKRKTVRYIPHD